MPMKPPPDSFILSSAVPSDIPTLAHLSALAFQSDTHTQLKAQFDGETSFEDGMKDAVESWMQNPRCDIIVARERAEHDGEETRVVGWICWGRRGYDTQPASIPSAPLPNPNTAPRTVASLKTLNNDAMSYYAHQLMPPGVRCRYIVALSVLPTHQGQGIGSALMRWGTERSDQDGVFCWVSSSMGGWPAFEKQGFREVGRLEVNLDEFSEGKARPDETLWGRYIWRWAKKEPQTVT